MTANQGLHLIEINSTTCNYNKNIHVQVDSSKRNKQTNKQTRNCLEGLLTTANS